jgi:hypothetical protein
MELLVYVRNHGGRSAGSTFVGASVGPAPSAHHLDTVAPMTSMAEFRIDTDMDDPIGELRTTVRELFEVIGAEKFGRPIYYARSSSAIRVRLEPGFDTAHEVECELAEMLARCIANKPARSATLEHAATL